MQLEHIGDELSRMCVARIIATRKSDIKNFYVAWLIVTMSMLYM